MATKTLAQLRTALASMWGYESFDDLPPQEQADVDTYIYGALFDCYVPVDGTRAYWPEKYHGAILKAPAAATLGLTNGSVVVTGYVFEDTYAGSFVKIGEKFYRYAKRTGSDPAYTYNLASPWDGDTGSYSATVYHNAVALPWSVIEIAGVPELVGVGLLGVMPDADAELLLRTEPAWDFRSAGGKQPFAMGRNQFRQSSYYDVGDPRFYHIDEAAVGATYAIGARFHVYPLPERAFTVNVRASVAPINPTDTSAVPEVPANAVDNILLPIAKEKLALDTAGRRYTGQTQFLSVAADRARQQLKSLRRVQRDTGAKIRLARNW